MNAGAALSDILTVSTPLVVVTLSYVGIDDAASCRMIENNLVGVTNR